jgi:calcineurin-like phosphoesterase
MKILFVADIFAQAGRRMASEHIPALLRDRDVDFVIAKMPPGVSVSPII